MIRMIMVFLLLMSDVIIAGTVETTKTETREVSIKLKPTVSEWLTTGENILLKFNSNLIKAKVIKKPSQGHVIVKIDDNAKQLPQKGDSIDVSNPDILVEQSVSR